MALSDISIVALVVGAFSLALLAWTIAGSWSALTPSSRARLAFGGFVLAGTLPILCAGLYFGATGRGSAIARGDWGLLPPDHPDIGQQPSLSDVETMTGSLAERLQRDPADADGWRMLGWSYFHLGRYAESVDAYGHAIALRPEVAAYRSAQAEAMVRMDGEEVTERARQGFAAALDRDGQDPTARFYVSLAKLRSGDRKGALDGWVALYKDLPAGEPLSQELHDRIGDLASELGISLPQLLPQSAADVDRPTLRSGPAPGPTAEDIRNADQMNPQDRQAMIAGMVDRLAIRLEQNPRDLDGWVKLARSRKVLGDETAARRALQRAYAVFEDAPAARSDLERASSELGLGPLARP